MFVFDYLVEFTYSSFGSFAVVIGIVYVFIALLWDLIMVRTMALIVEMILVLLLGDFILLFFSKSVLFWDMFDPAGCQAQIPQDPIF